MCSHFVVVHIKYYLDVQHTLASVILWLSSYIQYWKCKSVSIFLPYSKTLGKVRHMPDLSIEIIVCTKRSNMHCCEIECTRPFNMGLTSAEDQILVF